MKQANGHMAKRILVVEDNDLNRKLFCDVLKSQGYAIEPVADGLEALEKGGATLFFGHDPDFWKTVSQAPLPAF